MVRIRYLTELDPVQRQKNPAKKILPVLNLAWWPVLHRLGTTVLEPLLELAQKGNWADRLGIAAYMVVEKSVPRSIYYFCSAKILG